MLRYQSKVGIQITQQECQIRWYRGYNIDLIPSLILDRMGSFIYKTGGVDMFKKVAFIGAGSMAEAIISGVIQTSFLQREQIYVTNKNNQERLDRLAACYQITCSQDKIEILTDADVIVLSMKPYDIKAAMNAVKAYIRPHQLLISVVAGVSTDAISALIGHDIPIVRAMPNTSASIGYSATAIAKGKGATKNHLDKVESLFKTIGTTTIVTEDDMHTVTGISGSGPAYFYYMVEAMERAAVEFGLAPNIAKELITQTVIGAGEMLKYSGQSAATLRENITSPNGTTQAGLEILAQYNFEKMMMACIQSAKERSIELGGQNNNASAT